MMLIFCFSPIVFCLSSFFTPLSAKPVALEGETFSVPVYPRGTLTIDPSSKCLLFAETEGKERAVQTTNPIPWEAKPLEAYLKNHWFQVWEDRLFSHTRGKGGGNASSSGGGGGACDYGVHGYVYNTPDGNRPPTGGISFPSHTSPTYQSAANDAPSSHSIMMNSPPTPQEIPSPPAALVSPIRSVGESALDNPVVSQCLALADSYERQTSVNEGNFHQVMAYAQSPQLYTAPDNPVVNQCLALADAYERQTSVNEGNFHQVMAYAQSSQVSNPSDNPVVNQCLALADAYQATIHKARPIIGATSLQDLTSSETTHPTSARSREQSPPRKDTLLERIIAQIDSASSAVDEALMTKAMRTCQELQKEIQNLQTKGLTHEEISDALGITDSDLPVLLGIGGAVAGVKKVQEVLAEGAEKVDESTDKALSNTLKQHLEATERMASKARKGLRNLGVPQAVAQDLVTVVGGVGTSRIAPLIGQTFSALSKGAIPKRPLLRSSSESKLSRPHRRALSPRPPLERVKSGELSLIQKFVVKGKTTYPLTKTPHPRNLPPKSSHEKGRVGGSEVAISKKLSPANSESKLTLHYSRALSPRRILHTNKPLGTIPQETEGGHQVTNLSKLRENINSESTKKIGQESIAKQPHH